MMVPLEGAVGVGAMVDAILFGCAVVQSCVYHKNCREDKWPLKILVLLLLFLLPLHLGCVTVWLWASTEAKIEDSPTPSYAAIVLGISGVVSALISFLQRCLFSHRLLKTSNNPLLAFLFYLFCTFSFTATLGAASLFFTSDTADLAGQLNDSWVLPLSFIFGLFCDLAIAVATMYYLSCQTPTEVADTLGPVARLSRMAAETSSVTSLLDLIMVLAYWLAKANFIWVGLFITSPGVFANSLLVALNARGHLRVDMDIEHICSRKIGDQLIDKRAKKPPIMVSISKRAERRTDENPV